MRYVFMGLDQLGDTRSLGDWEALRWCLGGRYNIELQNSLSNDFLRRIYVFFTHVFVSEF